MITEEEAISLLRKYAKTDSDFDKVLNHSKAVQKVALRMASNCSNVDLEKIRIGSLLHDIGRFDCPPGKDTCKHGLIGGEILRKEGLSEFANIAENHLGAGLSKKDIVDQGLDLPEKDYIPLTNEEKIITHADNLIFSDREGSFSEVVERYRKELGEGAVKKIVKLKEEVDKICSK